MSRRRLDLLEQVSFLHLTRKEFDFVMSIQLPVPIMAKVVTSAEESLSDPMFSDVLALAGFKERTVKLDREWKIPLFAIQHIYERHVRLPARCTLVGGLDAASIPFWTRVFEENNVALLQLVERCGDYDSRILTRVRHEVVDVAHMHSGQFEVYRALLIRLHFGPMSNHFVLQNYKLLPEWGLSSYYAICACLDTKRYELIERYIEMHNADAVVNADASSTVWEALLDRMMSLNDRDLDSSVEKCMMQISNAPELLKALVRHWKTNGYYNSELWNIINFVNPPVTINGRCCLAPLSFLARCLVVEDISIEEATAKLEALLKMQPMDRQMMDIVRFAHTVIFWEAPENVVEHFLDKIFPDYMIKDDVVLQLLRAKKYSIKFGRKIVRGLRNVGSGLRRDILKIRPDMATELPAEDE